MFWTGVLGCCLLYAMFTVGDADPVTCPQPLIENGKRIAGGNGPYTHRMFVEYACQEGYKMETGGEMTCQSDGRWTRGPYPVCTADPLQAKYDCLVIERDLMEKTFKATIQNMMNQLQTTLNTMVKERDDHQKKCPARIQNMSHEMNQLQTTFNTMVKERDDLQKKCPETATCEDGWKKFGCSSCYYYSNESKPWEESRLDCISRGAHLVVVNSGEEQEFVFNNMKTKLAWIGLSDSAVEGNWTWVDGTPLTTAYWKSDQPDNGAWGSGNEGEEDCAGIYSWLPAPLQSWADGPCGYSLYWICEREI